MEMKLKTKTGKVYIFGSVTNQGADGICLELKSVSNNRLVSRRVVYPTWEKLLERLNTLEEIY